MTEKVFVIYRSNAGTSTARPMLEHYTDKEAHVPPLAVLGYDTATTAWVAMDSFVVPDAGADDTRAAVFVNPTAGTQSSSTVARYDVVHAQTEVLGQIADLIAEWNWTQELDAKISKDTQQTFADWIADLEAVPNDELWATNPKGITLPSRPAEVSSPLTVAQQVAEASWTNDVAVASQKLSIANWGTLPSGASTART